MNIKLKFATFSVGGIPRISMSREEILSTINSLDRNDKRAEFLIAYLEALEKELLSV